MPLRADMCWEKEENHIRKKAVFELGCIKS